jgi:glycosidase
MKKIGILMMALLGLFTSCNDCSSANGTDKVEYSRNAVLYEVNIRQYTPEGTFNAFAAHLPYLKELGVDIIWLMPIHPISELNRKGELGSYYAVQDYTAVNPEFGTMDDFKALVKQTHDLGMHIIIDWVANHTGCDHAWVTDHPSWYDYDTYGQLVSPMDWTDTYSLNYDNKDMQKAMIDAMKFWVEEVGIDGYRCDVASMVPTDFWSDVRQELDEIKPVFMLAESSEPDLTLCAFDMVYNWPAMFLFEEVVKGKKTADKLADLITNQQRKFPHDTYFMNHVTNHDRNTWDGTEFERLGAGVEAFVALTYVMPGMPLIYTGQEVGLQDRIPFFTKYGGYSQEKNNVYQFYAGLNQLKHEQPALKAGSEGGKWKVYSTTANDKVLFCGRELKGKDVLYLANLSNEEVVIDITDSFPDGEYIDHFTGAVGVWKKGMSMLISPWQYCILIRK